MAALPCITLRLPTLALDSELLSEVTPLSALLSPPCLCAQDDSALLEQHIRHMRSTINAMTEHPSNKARLFVTNEDIVRMQSTGSDTVFAVTAPQGTTLEIPDPDEGFELGTERRYR